MKITTEDNGQGKLPHLLFIVNKKLPEDVVWVRSLLHVQHMDLPKLLCVLEFWPVPRAFVLEKRQKSITLVQLL